MLADPPLPPATQPPVPLDDAQSAVLRRRESRRLIHGAAGSGKSVVLATLAAQALRRGERVLLVCYNIALVRHLRGMVARQLGDEGPARVDLTVLWFHEWAQWLYEPRHWDGWHKSHPKNWPNEEAPGELAELLEAIPPADEERFDLILADEGQDLRLTWLDMLGSTLQEGGRLVVTADTTQGTGGSGLTRGEAERAGWPVVTLPGSHRVHPQLRPVRYEVAQRLGLQREVLLPEQIELPFGQLRTYWIRGDASVLRQLRSQLGPLTAGAAVRPGGVAILFENKDAGEVFLRQHGEALGRIEHVFAEEGDRMSREHREKERRSRMLFGGQAEVTRVSTIDSIKGNEARVVVLVLDSADASRLYVGLTRVAQSLLVATLVVVARQSQAQVLRSRPFSERTLSGT